MTVSNVVALRPPDNPPPGDEWKPIPGAGYYEASHRGKIRSVDRVIDGKSLKGKELRLRVQSNGPYVMVNIRRDDKSVWTDTVHSFVLRAHVPGYPQPGEETLHGPGGPQDNRFPENILPGTHPVNVAQRVAASPPREPKPPKVCPRCQSEHTGPGRRCPECVRAIGQAAAALLEENPDPDKVAEMLDYPSPGGVVKLAVKHGGLRMHVGPCSVTAGDNPTGHAASTQSWLRRVINRAGASGRNSDAR